MELIVSWGIEIGVGGEAESVVEADVRLPVYCMLVFFLLFTCVFKKERILTFYCHRGGSGRDEGIL